MNKLIFFICLLIICGCKHNERPLTKWQLKLQKALDSADKHGCTVLIGKGVEGDISVVDCDYVTDSATGAIVGVSVFGGAHADSCINRTLTFNDKGCISSPDSIYARNVLQISESGNLQLKLPVIHKRKKNKPHYSGGIDYIIIPTSYGRLVKDLSSDTSMAFINERGDTITVLWTPEDFGKIQVKTNIDSAKKYLYPTPGVDTIRDKQGNIKAVIHDN